MFTFAFGADAASDPDPRLVDGAAEIVLLDGKVITVGPDNSIAQAVALRDGHIVAVGDGTAIRRLIGPKTHVIQLHGKAVLPGLIDAHTHIEDIADYHRMLDLHIPPLKDVDEMLRKIEERCGEHSKGRMDCGGRRLGQPMPTREQLDSATQDHPVLVRESAHEIVVNTEALDLAHIDKNTLDPVGSKIWRAPRQESRQAG